MENKIIIVSDKFSSFADDQHVFTLENLKIIDNKLLIKLPQKNGFLIGQGLTNKCYNYLEDYLSENNINSEPLSTTYSKNKYTHKNKSQNILIGNTEKIHDNLYHLKMFIDENCELMNDHQTGQHIQGMVIVEAFRQTFIAVTEEFFQLHNNEDNTEELAYYVINEMNINFLNFMFPLPIHIIYEIENKQIVQNKKMNFVAKIKAIQNHIVCAEMTVKFSVFPKKLITNKEQKLANIAIKNIHKSNEQHQTVVYFKEEKNE